MAAIRTKDTYLRALYERQRSRIGDGRAIGAVTHSMVVAARHMLKNGDLSSTAKRTATTYFTQRDPRRATRLLIAQLERLGHPVTRQPAGSA